MAWEPEWVSAGAACIAAAVAIASVVFAAIQVKMSRESSEDANKAYVVVDLTAKPGKLNQLHLEITNTGKTTARDVKILFSPPLRTAMSGLDEYGVENWPPVKNGIACLPPGKTLSTLADSLRDRVSQSMAGNIRITVLYYSEIEWSKKNKTKRKRTVLLYDVDLQVIVKRVVQESTDPPVEKSLNKMAKVLETAYRRSRN